MQNKKIKILIATGIYPPDIGGPATMLRSLSSDLLKNNFEVKIVTYADKKNSNDGEEIQVSRIIRGQLPFLRYVKYFLKMFFLSLRADIVYVPDTYSVGFFAYLIKKLTRKKYIIRFTGDSAWESSLSNGWTTDYIVDFQDKTYDEKIEKLKRKRKKILLNADKLIIDCYFLKKIAEKIGVASGKIKVVNNSAIFSEEVNLNKEVIEKISNKYRKVKNSNKKSKLIITSCRLTAWKGVDGIIKALAKVKKKIGEVNFIVIGDGPKIKELKLLAKGSELDSNVHFLGRIKHEETIKYFKAADLYVLNSNYEGLSHALLDAMKFGMPIIASNVGGNPELIDNNESGILVNYNNEEEIFNAIVKILSDDNFKGRIAKKALKRSENFNWENTVKLTKEIIIEVCR